MQNIDNNRWQIYCFWFPFLPFKVRLPCWNFILHLPFFFKHNLLSCIQWQSFKRRSRFFRAWVNPPWQIFVDACLKYCPADMTIFTWPLLLCLLSWVDARSWPFKNKAAMQEASQGVCERASLLNYLETCALIIIITWLQAALCSSLRLQIWNVGRMPKRLLKFGAGLRRRKLRLVSA